ncbi:YHYH domain-containing protein [Lysinibacillus sp. NPDC096418]|uniref:YHYH domain-containing protein n=1 Tax=Lysinibacillus sp. NPDC096418 TaxID=3364138 RepID=UPI00381ABF7E
MKKRIVLVTSLCGILLVPNFADAHPGRTDSNGGHTCRTNCEKWGLEYGEYHFHNGGRSSGGSSGRYSSPTPKPEPVIDENQVQADKYFTSANTYFTNGKYEEALAEAEKIYPLNRNINKANDLVNKSLESLFKKAELEFAAKEYYDAKNNLTYIFEGYAHANSQIKQKAKSFFEKIVKEEEFQNNLSKATEAKGNKNYDDAISILNELKKENKSTTVSTLYNDTVKELQNEADISFDKKDYKMAKSHYQLLNNIITDLTLKSQYTTRIELMQDEELIQKMLGIDKEDIEKNSLFEHLIVEENETPYNKVTIQTLTNLLKPKELDFIFDINIKELFKGVNKNAS